MVARLGFPAPEGSENTLPNVGHFLLFSVHGEKQAEKRVMTDYR